MIFNTFYPKKYLEGKTEKSMDINKNLIRRKEIVSFLKTNEISEFYYQIKTTRLQIYRF